MNPTTMKTTTKSTVCAALFVLVAAGSSYAQLNIPSDGSDGALNITTNTVIDLTQAVTGNWTNAGTGTGVYDPAQWAVVFKYSSVNIASGATVTFNNHYANPPVIWLVESNVTVNGTLSLSGSAGTEIIPSAFVPSSPGPGGFRGGPWQNNVGGGDGLGPDGGGINGGSPNVSGGYSGSYGNAQILPLIGGSGASWVNYCGEGSGPAGGGAILIAAGSTVTVNGIINAAGGSGTTNSCNPSFGAGGAIRIVANQVLGTGSINAAVGGRTRIEANSLSSQIVVTPNVNLVAPASSPAIVPAGGSPTVNIVSVAGLNAPADPQANLDSAPDIGLQTNGPVTVVLQTQNVPTTGNVALRVVPVYGASWTTNASLVSGTVASATWQVTAKIPVGYCALQAHATAQ